MGDPARRRRVGRPAPQRTRPADRPRVDPSRLAAWDVTQPQQDPPVLIDLDQIAKVTPLDATFTPQPIDVSVFKDGG